MTTAGCRGAASTYLYHLQYVSRGSTLESVYTSERHGQDVRRGGRGGVGGDGEGRREVGVHKAMAGERL